jgi:hypothetical protein
MRDFALFLFQFSGQVLKTAAGAAVVIAASGALCLALV